LKISEAQTNQRLALLDLAGGDLYAVVVDT
jgi:hypothetical protein